MSIYNQPNLTSGIDGTFVELLQQSLLYHWAFGFCIWICFYNWNGYTKAKTGHADMPMWAVMASISTLIVTLLLSIKSGLINIETLAIVISITVFSGLWLFLSKVLGKSPLIPPLFTRMLAVAEEAGDLSPMLSHIADLYEEEVDKSLTRATALLQPMLLLVLGAIVAFLLLSILLPLTDVSSIVQ